MKTHSDIKPYKCTLCYKTFRTPGQLNKHMGLVARKPVVGGLRITQAQTSLRIRAV